MFEKLSAIGIMGIVTYFITKLLTYLFFDNYIIYCGEYSLFSLIGFILICLTCSFGILGFIGIFILKILKNRI